MYKVLNHLKRQWKKTESHRELENKPALAWVSGQWLSDLQILQEKWKVKEIGICKADSQVVWDTQGIWLLRLNMNLLKEKLKKEWN